MRSCRPVLEMAKRALGEQLAARELLSSPQAVRDYLRLTLAGLKHEVFFVLWLDAQNRLIAAEELFRGTLTQTSGHPREVVKRALAHNAAAVILAHNHPSNCRALGRRRGVDAALKEALALVDVRLLDHFIVAGSATAVAGRAGPPVSAYARPAGLATLSGRSCSPRARCLRACNAWWRRKGRDGRRCRQRCSRRGRSAPAFVAPPRRVDDDILRLLDHYQPDPALVAKARDALAATPPRMPAANNRWTSTVGAPQPPHARQDRQIADLQAAIGPVRPTAWSGQRCSACWQRRRRTGDSQLAAARSSDEALLQLPRSNPGASWRCWHVGEVPRLARRPAGRTGASAAGRQTFAQLSGGRGWAQRGSQWTAMIHRAQAEVFLVEGRLIEAEGAAAKAMAAFEAHLRQNLPEGDGDNVQRRDGVLERTLAVTLLQQGRLAEAEFHVRRALRMTLERVGRDSVDVGQGSPCSRTFSANRGAMARRRALPSIDARLPRSQRCRVLAQPGAGGQFMMGR